MKGSRYGRRNFIKDTSALLAAASLPLSALSMKLPPKFKMGLQLFTIRDAMEKDPIGSLQKVHDLGYQDLETYGYNPKENYFYGYKADTFKNILEDHQLTTSTGHYNFSDFLSQSEDSLIEYTDQCIIGAKTLEQSYITWPWLAPEFRTIEAFKLVSEKLNLVGERVVSAGLGFAYHNHGFEFIEHDGEIGYNIITQETDPSLVKLQLDFYWVMHSAKETPAQIIAKDPMRFVMWHLKDMDKVSRDYTELGNGSINYPEILKETSQKGLQYYFIEQGGNFAHNSMQSITDSADYFKKNLQQYL
jgi:sugar phosphate isomerase/epimerase